MNFLYLTIYKYITSSFVEAKSERKRKREKQDDDVDEGDEGDEGEATPACNGACILQCSGPATQATYRVFRDR